MKVLVMGGTNFNGLALVHELVRQGHDVTVLNRGKSEATIPESVHRLVGGPAPVARRSHADPTGDGESVSQCGRGAAWGRNADRGYPGTAQKLYRPD